MDFLFRWGKMGEVGMCERESDLSCMKHRNQNTKRVHDLLYQNTFLGENVGASAR